MNTQQLAQTILERRQSMSPIVTQGEIISAVGSEGLQEALQRRWLVPQEDTGYLQVSTDMARIEEMQEMCEKCEKCGCKDCECDKNEKPKVSESREAVMSHAGFKAGVITELLSPGTGHDPQATMTPPPEPAGVTPTSSVGQGAGEKPDIGSEVIVAEDGRTFVGRVQSAEGDRYRLTFGNEKPTVTRDYAQNELKVLAATPNA